MKKYNLTEQCVKEILGAFLDDRGRSSDSLVIKSYRLIYFSRELYLYVDYLSNDEPLLEVVPLVLYR